MKIWNEFKEFAFKGNVIDMAVGVMIGTAFGKIVTSIVNDIFMPLIATVTGQVHVAAMALTLGEGPDAPVLAYGSFFQSVIDFLLLAICVFMFVKGISELRGRLEKPAVPATPARMCPYCVTEIPQAAVRCPHCTSHLDGKE